MKLAKVARTVCTAAILSLPSCGGDDGLDHSSSDDTGALCLSADNGNGNRLSIQAVIDSCVSSCWVVESATCRASITGDRIEVSSHLELTRPSSSEISCTTDCRRAVAECGVVLPEPGTHPLVYGPNEAEVSAPLSAPTPLFGYPNDCEFER